MVADHAGPPRQLMLAIRVRLKLNSKLHSRAEVKPNSSCGCWRTRGKPWSCLCLSLSKFPKFVTENPPSFKPWSGLILSRFPKFVTENPPSAKPRSCLILSRFPKFVTENPPQPASPDRVWSCPDFPNSLRKIPPQLAIFRNKFGKPWSCLILSRFPKFVTENPPQQAIFRNKFGKPWSCLILSSPDRVWSWSECLNSLRRRRRRRTKRNSMGLDNCRHLN